MRFTTAFYHARKFLAVFGLCIILLVSLFVTSVSAGVVTNSGYLTEGDLPLVTGVGNLFARYYNNATYYQLYNQDLKPPRDVCTSYRCIGTYVPNDSRFFNLGFESNMDYVLFAFSNQNTVKPGDVITFSCKLRCNGKSDLRNLDALHFLVQFFYVDEYTERLQVSVNVTPVYGTVICSLTFQNTTGRELCIFNVKTDGSWTDTYFTGGSFEMWDLRYHLYTSQELSTINAWNGQSKLPSSSGTVSDLDNAEQNLIGHNADGFNNFNDIMNGLSGRFNTYASAFASVSNFFMDIAYIPFFTAILYISIAFGIFALIVNLAMSLDKSGKGKERRQSKKSKGGGSS